jgi:hypothetical protein
VKYTSALPWNTIQLPVTYSFSSVYKMESCTDALLVSLCLSTSVFFTNNMRTIYCMGSEIFQKFSCHLQISGARRVTCISFHTEGPQFQYDLLVSLLPGIFCHWTWTDACFCMLKKWSDCAENIRCQQNSVAEELWNCGFMYPIKFVSW